MCVCHRVRACACVCDAVRVCVFSCVHLFVCVQCHAVHCSVHGGHTVALPVVAHHTWQRVQCDGNWECMVISSYVQVVGYTPASHKCTRRHTHTHTHTHTHAATLKCQCRTVPPTVTPITRRRPRRPSQRQATRPRLHPPWPHRRPLPVVPLPLAVPAQAPARLPVPPAVRVPRC